MKILIVTQYLYEYQGSELFTLSVSRKFASAGHEVSVYSPILGTVAKKIKESGIRVTDNLLDFENEPFDIIHAQHGPTAILARSVFTDTPIVFMAHGVLPELEQPPSIDLGIDRFIVISEEIERHLMRNYSIPKENIDTIRNCVDTSLFYPKNKLPRVLEKLLIISNHCPEEVQKIIRDACEELKIKVSHLGLPDNPASPDDVKKHIDDSDLIVSLGRGALEAMASGKNVIVYDAHGGDGFVDEKNFFEIRENNFSGRQFNIKFSKSTFKKELLKYDPDLGDKLSKIVMKEHSLDSAVAGLLKIYDSQKGKRANCNLKKLELYREIEFLERFNLNRTLSVLSEKTLELRKINASLEEKIAFLKEDLSQKDEDLSQKAQEIATIKASRLWRLRNMLLAKR